MSGSFESMRWIACVHKLDLGLHSHPKEFLGNGVRTHVNVKGKIPSTTKILRGGLNPRCCITLDSGPNQPSYSSPPCLALSIASFGLLCFLDFLFMWQYSFCLQHKVFLKCGQLTTRGILDVEDFVYVLGFPFSCWLDSCLVGARLKRECFVRVSE